MQATTAPDASDNLTQLRRDALTAMLIQFSAIGFVWLAWLLWPEYGKSISNLSWMGMIALGLGLVLGQFFKRRHLRLAASLFLLGGLGAATFVALIVPSPAGYPGRKPDPSS